MAPSTRAVAGINFGYMKVTIPCNHSGYFAFPYFILNHTHRVGFKVVYCGSHDSPKTSLLCISRSTLLYILTVRALTSFATNLVT